MTRPSEQTQEPVSTPQPSAPATQPTRAGVTPAQGARKRKAPRQKHVPVRTCVACRTADAKRSYVRLVRTPDGRVEIDPTGRRNGRGAYLCRTRACWNRAADGQQLERALNVQVDTETRAVLREYARTHFPPDDVAAGVVTVTITADELAALTAEDAAAVAAVPPQVIRTGRARGQPLAAADGEHRNCAEGSAVHDPQTQGTATTSQRTLTQSKE